MGLWKALRDEADRRTRRDQEYLKELSRQDAIRERAKRIKKAGK